MSPVASRLRELREARGWNQSQLATESGVSQGVISRLEAGKSGGTVAVVERLARALGVPVGYLFGGAPETPKRRRPRSR